MASSGSLDPNSVARQAATAPAGVALINGTPTILTYTTPNNGRLHVAEIAGVLHVTGALTGGALQVNYTCGGVALSVALAAGGQAAGDYQVGTLQPLTCDPNTAVSVVQQTAMTAGAGVLRAAVTGY